MIITFFSYPKLISSFQPCPICSDMVVKDMVNHITMQHGYLFKVPSHSPLAYLHTWFLKFQQVMHRNVSGGFSKLFFPEKLLNFDCLQNRRRLRRFIIPGSQALSLLSQDLRESHLQVLLGGGQRSSNNNTTTNISADPLLSSFGLSFPTSDAEEKSKSTIPIPDDSTIAKETPARVQKRLRYIDVHAELKHCCR
jgi:hypothetical protein